MLRLDVEVEKADSWAAPRLGVRKADATKSNTGDKVRGWRQCSDGKDTLRSWLRKASNKGMIRDWNFLSPRK